MLEAAPESIDAVRFERLARDGRDALLRDPKQVVDTLRAALALWRGEPLAEFGFELFAQAEITRLTELRIAVLENCVEAKLALGRHAVLCAELTLAVTEHPLRERLWSQLIRALYRCGRQAEALGAYARLREQLGIDPSPELVRLHEAVLASVPIWTGHRRNRKLCESRRAQWPCRPRTNCCRKPTLRWRHTTGSALSTCCLVRTARRR